MKPALETHNYNVTTKPSALPTTEALPDAFLGADDALRDETKSPDWLGDGLLPHDVPFAQMVLLDRLRRRPYHTVHLDGPMDGKRMAQAYADKLYRTEVYLSKRGKRTSVTRLMLCLGEGVFAFFENGSVTVYA